MNPNEMRAENKYEAAGLIVILFVPIVWLGIHGLISAFRNGYIVIRNTTVYRDRRREEFWFWICGAIISLVISVLVSQIIGFLSWEDLGSAIGVSVVALLALAVAFRRPKEKRPKVDWVLSWVVVSLLLFPGVRNTFLAFQTNENRIQAVLLGVFCWSAIGVHGLVLIRKRPVLKFIKPPAQKRKR